MDATWRALADPTRRRLIELLRDGPRTTGELCRAFPTSRFAVMKHLAVLERGGLLTVRRDGRTRWNSLNLERLQQVGAHWAAPTPSAVPAFGPDAELMAWEAEKPMIADDTRPGPPTTTTEVFVDAVAWKVFDALTVNVSAWWGEPHLRSSDASNLVLEPQPGGRFYEEWGHRQGALRGLVSAIRQDERLSLAGPIFHETQESRLSFSLEAREGGTLLAVTCEQVPEAVVADLFRVRLKAFVERGIRSGIQA